MMLSCSTRLIKGLTKCPIYATLHKKNKELVLKKDTGLIEYSPTVALLNEELIGRALWECLKEGDVEGFMEVIEAYLAAYNRTHLAKKAAIARSTIYHLKSGNPTVKTVAKVVHACS